MKTIHLKHNGQNLNLSADQAIELHKELTTAMSKSGIDPSSYRTVDRPGEAHLFSRKEKCVETDC